MKLVLRALLAGLFIAGCAGENASPRLDAGSDPGMTFPTSLHATAEGMRTMFTRADGLGPFTGVDYEILDCKYCHATCGPPRDTCESCHGTTANKALQDYTTNDKITVTWWNAGTLERLTGVIPIVDGKMELQFLSHDAATGAWSPLDGSGPAIPDGTQYAYGSALTPIQLEKMQQAQTE
jgi:hypothetical protein